LIAYVDDTAFPAGPVEFQYYYGLVALSVAVASLGCFTGLLLTIGVDVRKRVETVLRITFGGISAGGSIWAMHFIGLLAVRMPALLTYDTRLTALSASIAVLTTAFALAAVGLRFFGDASLTIASIIMGLGMGAMHYTGMAAIQGECSVAYTELGIGIAIIIAIEASLIALNLTFSRNRGIFGTAIGSVALGLAIASMHYSAMEGTRFLPIIPNPDFSPAELSGAELALAVTVVAYVVCSISIMLYAWIVFRPVFRPA
jgi:NO-binding membrane sensor protein with MHYT domain